MRGDLPSGTVTFLFTDVEGSTKLLHELGANEYAQALAEHRRILRAAFATHGGVEVDTQGDAFFVAFPTASGALSAAAELTGALAGGPIRVRVGVHTGTPFLAEEGYVGVDVHRAARIAAAGHGAQVLVSASTAALVDGVELRDLGEHRFKDLAAAERVFQLGQSDFPPLKTLFQTNLPVPATPFLGRERELAEIAALLEEGSTRLVTLTGPGGSGKTRLGLQAAGAAADGYPQGVWWVPLAAVGDPGSVLDAVGRALGASGGLAEAIRERRLLLLLDNFEHVIAAASALSSLLAACPNLDVLVTSRERLRIAGEQVYPVPVLARAEASELFATRARAVRPDFTLDDSVDELCERLDDLPLALELAAARTVMLTGQQLLERLGSRLDLLQGGRDADRRQQTLRATIEWSYDLLEPSERRLFARLAVFAGGCTLAAAEEICGADLDTLQSLIEKSLVRFRDEGRFWMLETIRELALERLAASGEEAAMRSAHAAWFHELAVEGNLAEDARGAAHRYDLVLPEEANLRAAIDWAEAQGEVELALSLVVELENYWVTQSPVEGNRRARDLLARGGTSERLRARAHRIVGSTSPWAEADAAAEAYGVALGAFRALGDEAGVARLLGRLASVATWRRDFDEARRLIAQAQEILSRVEAPRLEAQLPGVLAQVERASGNYELALELCLETARRAHEVGVTWWEAAGLMTAGEVADELDRPDEAASLLREGLRLSHSIRDSQNTGFALALLAALAAEGGDANRAGVLWGAFENIERRSPVDGWHEERDAFERRVRGVPEEAVQRGRKLTLDEAVAYALEPAGA